MPTSQDTADTDRGARSSVLYRTITKTHKQYDANLLEQLEDLYKGGFHIQKKAEKYLFPVVNEHPDRFKERCRTVSYQPYFGQIVDQFVSDLFGQPLSIKAAADANDPKTPGDPPDKDYYTDFEKNVDKEGTSFLDLMEKAIRTALKMRCALIQVDAPTDDSPAAPVSRADEEARGTRKLYAYEVPVDQLINWKMSPGDKSFVWAVLRKVEQPQESPFDSGEQIVETFTVWTLGDKFAEWRRYSIRYDPDQPPDPTDPVYLEGAGITRFEQIPLFRLQLPEGLWVGNKIGTQAKEHYQRRSVMVGSENRNLVSIPFFQEGPQAPMVGGAIPADISQNPHRGNNPVGQANGQGWVHGTSEDKLSFVEPTGTVHEVVDRQLEGLKEAMFAVTHLMAASIRPTGAALQRSGLSKQKDEDATSRVLRKLGSIVRDFGVLLYDFVSQSRGEDVHWSGHGLDGYEHEDREQVLEEAISMSQVPIPSVTFRKAHARMMAEKILKGIEPATLATILEEIEDGIEADEEMRQLQNEAAKAATNAAIESPPIPGVKPATVKAPAEKAPQTKQPAVGKKA